MNHRLGAAQLISSSSFAMASRSGSTGATAEATEDRHGDGGAARGRLNVVEGDKADSLDELFASISAASRNAHRPLPPPAMASRSGSTGATAEASEDLHGDGGAALTSSTPYLVVALFAGLLLVGVLSTTTENTARHYHISVGGRGGHGDGAAGRNAGGHAFRVHVLGKPRGPVLGAPGAGRGSAAAARNVCAAPPAGGAAAAGFAVATACDERSYTGVLLLAESLRAANPGVFLLVFDVGMTSSESKMAVRALPCTELVAFPFGQHPHLAGGPAAGGAAGTAWKPIAVELAMRRFGVLVWADADMRVAGDLAALLQGLPARLALAGPPPAPGFPAEEAAPGPVWRAPLAAWWGLGSGQEPGQPLPAHGVATHVMVVVGTADMYWRVLGRWSLCAQDRSCVELATQAAAAWPRGPAAQAGGSGCAGRRTLAVDEAMLSLALAGYAGGGHDHAGDVLLGSAAFGAAFRCGGGGDTPPPGPASASAAMVRRLGGAGAPLPGQLVVSVPRYGPNNQLKVVTNALRLATEFGARFVAVAIQPHYKDLQAREAQHKGLGGAQAEADEHMIGSVPVQELLSPYVLHQRAVLAEPSSSWAALVPTLDFIDTDPCPKGSACPATSAIKVAAFCNMTTYTRMFGRASGLQASTAHLPMARIRCSPADFKSCLTESLRRGRSVVYTGPYDVCKWAGGAATCGVPRHELKGVVYRMPRLQMGMMGAAAAALRGYGATSLASRSTCVVSYQLRLKDHYFGHNEIKWDPAKVQSRMALYKVPTRIGKHTFNKKQSIAALLQLLRQEYSCSHSRCVQTPPRGHVYTHTPLPLAHLPGRRVCLPQPHHAHTRARAHRTVAATIPENMRREAGIAVSANAVQLCAAQVPLPRRTPVAPPPRLGAEAGAERWRGRVAQDPERHGQPPRRRGGCRQHGQPRAPVRRRGVCRRVRRVLPV